MKKSKVLALLFTVGLFFPAVLAYADTFTSFSNVTECQNGDEFIMYRSGTGTRNVTCGGINTYIDGLARFETLTATAGNNFTTGKLGYITSTGTVSLANASNAATANGLLVIATTAINGGNSGKFQFLEGKFTTSGLTPGASYYIDTVDGGITTTKPSADGAIQRQIGIALNSTTLIFGLNTSTVATSTGGGGGGPPSTTPTVESSSKAFESDGSVTVAAPLDIIAGDLLLLFAATDETDASTTTYTPPAGFTALFTQQRANAGGAGTDFGAWYKIAGVGEPTSYVLGESLLKNTAAVMLRVSGVDPANPLDTVSCTTGTAEPFTAPSIGITVDDALQLAIHAWDASKTLVLAPAGFTQNEHSDNSGVDLWVGSRTQALSGASGTNVMDVSSGGPYIACNASFQETNATSTGGGGGGGSPTEGPGPFSVLNDGTPAALPIKITLPIACDGSFVGSACEIFPSTDFHWETGDPALETYEHPTYFIRDPNFYRFCSPNSGATTSTANNGRSEFRYLQNHASGVLSRQFVFKNRNEDMVTGLIANIGQIHRNPGSPVFKGTYSHVVTRANTAQGCTSTTITLDAGASATDDAYNGQGITITGGTGLTTTRQVRHITDYVGSTKVATINRAWGTNCASGSSYEIGAGYYRALSKPFDGGTDTSFNIGLGDKRLLSNLVSNSFIRVRYEWNMSTEELKFWVSDDEDVYTETLLSGTPTATLTGVQTSGQTSYSKVGMYMNNAGSGSNTTPYCTEIWYDAYTGP